MKLAGYEASPFTIDKETGLVVTDRSGIGPWGEQSKRGLKELCEWLATWISKNGLIVEVGAYAGETTASFARVAPTIAIDPWKNGYDDNDESSFKIPMEKVFKSFKARTDSLPVRYFIATGEKASSPWPLHKKPNFVYIDMIHKIGPTRDEIHRWIPLIAKGGYIGGHDFCGYWGEVVDAVLETVGLPDIRFCDGSWAKKVG